MASSLRDFYLPHVPAAEPWKANDYGSARSQRRRFKVATETLGIRSGDRVADVGCGTGEYAAWLWEHGLDVSYTGFDAVPEMLARARAEHPGIAVAQLNAFEVPIPKSHEWAVCLGVLGVISGSAAERWKKVSQLLGNLHGSSHKGFIVSAQTDRGGPVADETGMRWFVDPKWLIDLFLEAFPSSRVVVRMDYHPHDMMLAVLNGSF